MIKNEIDQIITRCSRGELQGFSDLYRQYFGLIRSVLFKLCTTDDLDDLVQEAFMRIWKALPKFSQKSQLKTWIYRITYNLAVDNLRQRKRREPLLEYKEEMSESKAEDMTSKDQVQKGLQQLGEEHRSVLVLACMEGLTTREIADVVKVPEGTVKSRLHHAKIRMAELLKKQEAPL